MATETDCWSCPDPPSQHQGPQDVPISEILDHGSISFGRFAVESLAWEKRSVFSHNRCKEELEKFRAPGLVAEKKAYFEEYYRKIRAMKALEAEQQEATQPDSCQDMQNDTPQLENDDDAISEDEIKISNVRQIPISDNDTATFNSSEKDPLIKSEDSEKQLTCSIGNKSRASMPHAITSLSNSDSDHSVHVVLSSSSIRPIDRSSAKGSKEHSIDAKAKGTVASGRDKAKLDRGTMKTTVNQLKKQKTPNKETTRKTNNGLASRKTNLKGGFNIVSNGVPPVRERIEECRDTSVLRTMANNKRVLSSPSLKGGQVKTKQTSKHLDKLSTRPPVQAQSVQSTSSPNSVNISLKNMSLDDKRNCNGVAGKSSQVNGHHVKPRGVEYDSQRPKKVMSSKLPGQDKPNKNTVVEVGPRSVIKAGKKNEGKSQVTGPAKDLRGVSSLSSVSKTLTTKRINKVTPTLSSDTTHDRRAPRHTTPSWR